MSIYIWNAIFKTLTFGIEIMDDILSDVSGNKYYSGLAVEIRDSSSEERQKEWRAQRDTLGFDETETWDLFVSIAQYTLPRLKHFRENIISHPGTMTMDEWKDILQKMIDGFEIVVDDNMYVNYPIKSKILEEGLALFAKYYTNLWD